MGVVPAARCRFFFSSRRRHTRFDCDWSSDVCSSDLWLISWRERIDPLIRGVQERIGETRRRIEEIPDRIREALLPVTDSMTTANAELGELVRAAVPPPLLARAEAAVAPEEDALDVGVPGTNDWPSGHGVAESAFSQPAWWWL